MSQFAEEIIKRRLREYYNEAVGVLEEADDGEITTSQSEDALIELDAKYAEIIVKELEND